MPKDSSAWRSEHLLGKIYLASQQMTASSSKLVMSGKLVAQDASAGLCPM